MKVEIEYNFIPLTVDTYNETIYAGGVNISELLADKMHADIVSAAIEHADGMESEQDEDDNRDFRNDIKRLNA